ncbi:MAG: hypothetical protein ABID38_02290 [Candidatus Diapherotrites archaeon]
MVGTIILPKIGQPKTTRDAVISILSQEWPLSAKQIYNKLQRENGFAVSYQAAHKILKELEKEKIICVDELAYSINPEWVERIGNFAKMMQESFASFSNGSGSNNFYLDSIYNLDSFMVELAEKIMSPERQTFCIYWSHFWIPLFQKETYRRMREMIEASDSYGISKSSTVLDQWCEKFWTSSKVRMKCGIDLNTPDFIVYGDFVIQVYYPKEIIKELDKIYSSCNNISEFDMSSMFENVFEKKTKIPITINQNPELAKQLRGKMLGYFKGGKK